MKAVKIAMRANSQSSNNPKDIESIFISSESGNSVRYDIKQLYDILMENPEKRIYVSNSNFYLIPMRATNGQKYIRSTPNLSIIDGLMKLPRC